MQRFCFVHAADLHLDTPFEGIRSAAPEVAAALRDASLDAWDALVELCIERGAAFLLVAGDVYDGAARGLRAQLRFRRGLERLSRCGIQAFVVHGNHDPTEEGWSAIRSWPPGTHVFGAEAVTGVAVTRAGRRLATVYGISYSRRDVADNLALAYPRRGAARPPEPGDTGLAIGLLHCNVGQVSEHAAYSPCTLEDLASRAIDYWALGHVHRHQVLSRPGTGRQLSLEADDPWVVYPGNLQGRSPQACERGAKGAVVVEVEAGAVTNVELCAVDRVRFLELPLDVSGLADLAAVERALSREAEELRARHEGRALVLCVRLSGRSELHRDLARAGSGQDLLASLRDASRDARPFVWWAALAVEVGREIDRDVLRERDDFTSELVATGDELRERPEELAHLCEELFADLPPALRGVELPAFERTELLALLDRAEETAFEWAEERPDDGTTAGPATGGGS